MCPNCNKPTLLQPTENDHQEAIFLEYCDQCGWWEYKTYDEIKK